jgi:hypothetical protein
MAQTSRWHNMEVGLCDSRVPVLQLFLAVVAAQLFRLRLNI